MAGLLTRGLGLGTPLVLHGLGASSSASYSDLIAACIAQLRATPAVVAAFGDASNTPKFAADVEVAQPNPPFAVFFDDVATVGQESEEADGDIHYYPEGTIRVEVYAAGKVQAKTLRNQIVAALNDAALSIDGASVLIFRIRNDQAPPSPGVLVGFPQGYMAQADFAYILDRVYA